jgi:predicted phage terminase large subunit-like protein
MTAKKHIVIGISNTLNQDTHIVSHAMTKKPLLNINNIEHIRTLVKMSLMGFVSVCLAHYVTKQMAKYHHSMGQMLDSDEKADERLLIVGYPGSAKSVFISLAFPLWRALTGRSKFIIIVGDTERQVSLMIRNIRHEVDNNRIIRLLFPHVKIGSEWSASRLEIGECMIMGASRGQNIRGMRFGRYRPDTIVIDDPEALQHVKTKTKRDDTESWFNNEIVPRMQEGEKIKLVITGNLVHNDSFIARLLKDKSFNSIKIPIKRKDGSATWTSMFPTPQSLLEKEIAVRSKSTWLREYLLTPMPEDDQVVKNLHYYTDLPRKFNSIAISVDLAISKKTTADFTAVVVAGEADDKKIYMMRAKRGRWNFNETMEQVYNIYISIKELYPNAYVKIGFEGVSFQQAAIEEFERRYKLKVQKVLPGQDKRSKLESVSWNFESGEVLFPETSTGDMEVMENEILFFGVEEHDDLMDAGIIALKMLINKVVAQILWA